MNNNQFEKEFNTILERKDHAEQGSYTNYLFEKGIEKILKKVGEESTEVVIAALAENKQEQIGEICDLTYHVMVLMAKLSISLEDIEEELKKRSEKSNNLKPERKKIEKR